MAPSRNWQWDRNAFTVIFHIYNLDTSQFTSTSTKQWLQVEIGNENLWHRNAFTVIFHIYNLDFKPLFVPIEANSGSVFESFRSCAGDFIIAELTWDCDALTTSLLPGLYPNFGMANWDRETGRMVWAYNILLRRLGTSMTSVLVLVCLLQLLKC